MDGGSTIKRLEEIVLILAHSGCIMMSRTKIWDDEDNENDDEKKGRKFIEIGVCHTNWISITVVLGLIDSLRINGAQLSSISFELSMGNAWRISIHGICPARWC